MEPERLWRKALETRDATSSNKQKSNRPCGSVDGVVPDWHEDQVRNFGQTSNTGDLQCAEDHRKSELGANCEAVCGVLDTCRCVGHLDRHLDAHRVVTKLVLVRPVCVTCTPARQGTGGRRRAEFPKVYSLNL